MAVTKTAKRAIRQAEARKILNDPRKKTMKEKVKQVRSLIIKKDKSAASKDLSGAFQALDKAVKRGIIKKGNASRKKSRLAKAIAKIEK